jgi:hypothetical protein
MVKENYYPHPCNKTLEHFQEFGLEQLILCLVDAYLMSDYF